MSQITESMKQALSHHQAGRLDQALALYQAVLDRVPGHADALHLVGLVSHQQGRHSEAVRRIGEAIATNSDVAAYHNNLGAAQRAAGQIDLAIASFRRATELKPDFSSAWSNLVQVHAASSDDDSVSEALDQWVRNTKGATGALQHRAAHRYANKDVRGAMADQGRIADNQPEDHRPCLQVAILAHELGEDAVAIDAFSKAQTRHYRSAKLGNGTVRSKLDHDVEQIEWLVSRGMVPEDWTDIADAYRQVRTQLFDSSSVGLVGRTFSPEMRASIGRWYNRPIHTVDCRAIAGGALASSWDAELVEGRYRSSDPGITWIDGLLRPEAKVQLRDFCLGSTIWSDFKYSGGYVGTSLANGFANGLLLQIARELRERLPGLLGRHPLRQMWAYKCDQRLTGIGVHADAAAVNVNFWITPDEANLDPTSGGIRVWRKCAPMEWDFEAFNRRPEELLAWVRDMNAEEVAIPHRSNRALIFDSNLVHRTDDLEFAPGYENRRINITMLFGERGG